MAVTIRIPTFKDLRRPKSGRMVECLICHKELPSAKAHLVVARLTDEVEASLGEGGTAMVAEYHRKCCPGNCSGRHRKWFG